MKGGFTWFENVEVKNEKVEQGNQKILFGNNLEKKVKDLNNFILKG